MSETKDISLLVPELKALALEAGELAVSMQADAMENVMIKPDQSPVTEADKRLETLIIDRLKLCAADIPVIGEETVAAHSYSDFSKQDCFFLVDPIDGTRAYIKGRSDYTVNIAVIKNSRPVFGVIYAPAMKELFCGGVNYGCYLNGHPIQVKKYSPDRALRIVVSRYYARQENFSSVFQTSIDYEVEALSSSLKCCRIAQGLADFYPRFGPTGEWDTAAAQAILEGAGGSLSHARTHDALQYGTHQRDGKSFLNPDFVAVGDRDILKILV